MEKNKHTPGPWVAERNHDHDWVVSQPGNDGQVIVALRYVDGPEWEANAKLLASAPDLLAALETALPTLQSHMERYPNDKDERRIYDAARAAIAKARGGGK